MLLKEDGDVSDLLSAQIGGGRFLRGRPIAEAAERFGVSTADIEAIPEVLILDYRGRNTPAEAPPERILVLDAWTLNGLKSERVEEPESLKSERVEEPEASVAMVEDPAAVTRIVEPPATKPKKVRR